MNSPSNCLIRHPSFACQIWQFSSDETVQFFINRSFCKSQWHRHDSLCFSQPDTLIPVYSCFVNSPTENKLNIYYHRSFYRVIYRSREKPTGLFLAPEIKHLHCYHIIYNIYQQLFLLRFWKLRTQKPNSFSDYQ